MIFNIFKRKQKDNISISGRLTAILNQHPNNLHITIYIKEQVLFQIMPARNFINNGFKTDRLNDFVVLHFFNKNKTLIFDKLSNIKGTEIEKDFFFFEEPKGNFNYLKSIGNNPKEIEKEIYNNFRTIYELKDLNEITIDYTDY